MNEYCHRESKYASEVEPVGFKVYQDLVEHTQKMMTKSEKSLNEQKTKLFSKGFSDSWQITD